MIYRLTLEAAKEAAELKGFETYTIVQGKRSFLVLEGIHNNPIGGTVAFQSSEKKELPATVEVKEEKSDTKITVDQLHIQEGELPANPPINAKPPLGLMPYWQYYESRVIDLERAILDYTKAGIEVPTKWRFELVQLKGLMEMLSYMDTPIPEASNKTPNPLPAPKEKKSEPAAAEEAAQEPVANPSPISDQKTKKTNQPEYTKRYREKNKKRVAAAQSDEPIKPPLSAVPLAKPETTEPEEEEADTNSEGLELEPMKEIDEKKFKPERPTVKRDTKPVIKVPEANPDEYVAEPSPVFRKTDDDHPMLRNLSDEMKAKTRVVPKISKEAMAHAIARAKQIAKGK